MISRAEALRLLDMNVSNMNVKKHMIAVSAIMEELANRLNKNKEPWILAGLLHDIDYERVGKDLDRHGSVSAEMLKGMLSDECLHAIKAHNKRTGVVAETLIDKALITADAVSGLIVAAALVMPNRTLSEVRLKTLKNKFKDRSFARKVDRKKIMLCKEIGFDFEDFLELALNSLQVVNEELGL